ncbi:MAG: hypothetical protein AAB461_01985 [Patescibacteria group bacterium]
MADKNRKEKEIYRKILRENFPFEDATYSHDSLKEKVGQASDTFDRDADDEKKIDTTVRPPSIGIRVGDTIKEHWLPGLVIASIFFILGLLYNQGADIGSIQSDVRGLQQSIEELKQKYDKVYDSNSNVNLLKIEFSKDLEFLRERVQRIETKFP